jgi:curved DNA-binding protein CbpA
MPNPGGNPYETLGVSATASDAEVRSAYRRLVKLHHPDHNGGSEEAEQRFEAVQNAYAQIRELRKTGAAPRRTQAQPPPPRRPGASSAPPRSTAFDPEVEERMAKLEQELKAAHEARERARRAAREAAAASYQRPTDDELGYVTTDDSFSKILSDARSEVSDRLAGAREHPVAQRVSNLIDELEELLTKGMRDRHGP